MVQQAIKRPSTCGIIVLAVIVIGGIGYFLRPKEQTARDASGGSFQSINAPPAPTLTEIAQKKKALTDAQWDAYADTLKGKGISNWPGTVQGVDEKPFSSDIYVMTVDMIDIVPGYAFDIKVDLAKADALKVNKGASVSVSGVIRKIDCVLTYCPIELDSASYSLK